MIRLPLSIEGQRPGPKGNFNSVYRKIRQAFAFCGNPDT
jgi:hypothetical protein